MNTPIYDLIIVGAGLYGSIIAWKAKKLGLRCMVLEKRSHIGGNVYDEQKEGINVHCFGPHIFHTKDEEIWKFANNFIKFNHFRYSPLANYHGKLYNLPFNMHTFYQIYGARTPEEAKLCLQHEHEKEFYTKPNNLEEQAISLIGRTIYNCLVKGYTEKQWGRPATELPTFIISRLPIRYTYDNNYFNDPFQGIPIEGYTMWIKRLLEDIEINLNTDFLQQKEYWLSQCKHLIYTGTIDALHDYQLGELEYRSLRFEHLLYDKENIQGCAVINETETTIPFTRSIEHKHFEFGKQPHSILTREYPQKWERNKEPFYPVNNKVNEKMYSKYKEMTNCLYKKIILGGRLGDYQYYNMDEIIKKALDFILPTSKKL